MIIGIDKQGLIRQVDSITDTTLIQKIINDGIYSKIRLLCSKYEENESGYNIVLQENITDDQIEKNEIKQQNIDLQNQVLELQKSNTLKILQTTSTTHPQDITITDKSTYWDIIVTRNITSQSTGDSTIWSYEYIETGLPKTTDTEEQIRSVLINRKDALFSDAEYPAFNTYDANTSSTDLLKLVFALIDTNKSLSSRITALEAK